jgi:hypothetical protein
MLEQEIYEQMIAQGMDEFSADLLAQDMAVDMGEYDDPDSEEPS